MSYRLIDANALAIYCKQVNDMPCIYADLPNGLDGNHYIIEQSKSNRGSRWYELFGTPERAARTLASMCQFTHGELCERCPNDGCDKTLRLMCASTINDALLEWLRMAEG